MNGTSPSVYTKPDEICAPDPQQTLPAEVLFDKGVYGGISYAAQALTGILLTRWLKYGSGKKYFEKMTEWAGPKLFKKIAEEKGVAAAAAEASTPIMVSTMIMVGNAFLIPVKLLENRKPEIVRWLHERHVDRQEAQGRVFSEEERAQHEECLKRLEAEPKQTWWSLLGGRAFGLGAVYATLFAIGNKNNEKAEKWSANAILKGLDKIGLKKLAKSKLLEQHIHVGFLDAFYSAVSTSGLYVYSHMINPPKKSPESPENPTGKVASEIDILGTELDVPVSRPFKDRAPRKAKPLKSEPLYTQKLASETEQKSTSPTFT